MPAKGNKDNLRPPFTPEEAREYGKKGAIKSAESRRLKASMRDAAARWMVNQTSIKVNGKPVTGEEVCSNVFDRVMARADSVSVELIKTMGRLLDGDTLEISGNIETTDLTDGLSYEEKKARLAAIIAKRNED